MTDAEFIELADELATYAGDPVKFVENMFDWKRSRSCGQIDRALAKRNLKCDS